MIVPPAKVEVPDTVRAPPIVAAPVTESELRGVVEEICEEEITTSIFPVPVGGASLKVNVVPETA